MLGVRLQGVMGIDTGGKCVGAGTEGVGDGVGFSRLSLFLIVATWFLFGLNENGSLRL